MAGYSDMDELIDEFNHLSTVAAGDEGRQGVEASMNTIVGKLEQIPVEENTEHLVRIFRGKTVDARDREENLFSTFILPQESTEAIGDVLGDADSLILHDRQGRARQVTASLGEDGRYRFTFTPNGTWIHLLTEDGFRGTRQDWEIWLLKEPSAGHFRALSLRPHHSRETRIAQAGVAGQDLPAGAGEEEEEPAAEEADKEE